VPISKFVPGGIHANILYNITMPFTAFAQRSDPSKGGEKFDFVHFKDYTWNKFAPANVEYRFYSLVLKGNCGATGTATTTTNGTAIVSGGASQSTGVSASPSPNSKNATSNAINNKVLSVAAMTSALVYALI